MLHQHEQKKAEMKAYDDACVLAGRDSNEYTSKIAQLRTKWTGQCDTTCDRLILPLLSGANIPIHYAVIADNLDYFKANHETSKIKLDETLRIACLCGSKDVAEFILATLKLNYLSPGCEFVLSYAAASENTAWVEQIATEFSKAGRTIPEDIYIHTDPAMIRKIKAIFRNPQEPQNNCTINTASNSGNAAKLSKSQ